MKRELILKTLKKDRRKSFIVKKFITRRGKQKKIDMKNKETKIKI